MTTATRTPPHHNNLSCYKHYDCRLPACVARNSAYTKSAYRRRGYGTWQPFVDAEPVREHVQMLIDYGISIERTAEIAGVRTLVVARLVYRMGERDVTKRMRATNAEQILAVEAIPENIDPLRRIDATGTRRRLQALAAIGFPFMRLGEHLPIHPNTVHYVAAGRQVQARTARVVADLYDRLWDQDPTQYGVRPATALKVSRAAKRQGWRDPQWWEDYGHIDDPDFDPDTADAELSFRERAELRREEIEHLAWCGDTPEQIHERLGHEVSISTVRQIAQEWRTKQKRNRKQVDA